MIMNANKSILYKDDFKLSWLAMNPFDILGLFEIRYLKFDICNLILGYWLASFFVVF